MRAAGELGEHRGAHRFTVGQRRGLGIGGGTPLYVLATDADANTVTRRAARGARDPHGRAARRRAAPAARSTACGCATASARSPARALRRDGQLTLALAEPVYGVAPGQLACLMDGELIVGHATIAAALRRCGRQSSPARAAALSLGNLAVMTSDEIRERFLEFFAERDHLRLPSASLVPAANDTVGAVHDRRHAPAQAVLPRPGAARRRRA